MAITFVGHGTTVVNDLTAQTAGVSFSPNASTLTDDFMLAVVQRDEDASA